VSLNGSKLASEGEIKPDINELYSEYYINRQHFLKALTALYKENDKFSFLLKRSIMQPMKHNPHTPFFGAPGQVDNMSIKFIW